MARASRVSIKKFLEAIAALPAKPQKARTDKWYRTQKEHWIGWLSEYHGPGFYGRRPEARRDAEIAYDRIAEPEMLLWLIEAAGIDSKTLLDARRRAGRETIGTKKSRMVRECVPWGFMQLALWGPPPRRQPWAREGAWNVWFVPLWKKYSDKLSKRVQSIGWSVSSNSSKGDLVLYYRTAPESFVRDLFVVTRPPEYIEAGYRAGKDWMAGIRRVATLDSPLRLSQMQSDRILRFSGFVRGQMRSRYRATPYWREIYQLIVDLNPSVRKFLREFDPSRVL